MSGLLPVLAFLFKFPDTGFGRHAGFMLGAGPGSFVHERRYELSGVRVLSLQFSALSLDGEVQLGTVTRQDAVLHGLDEDPLPASAASRSPASRLAWNSPVCSNHQ